MHSNPTLRADDYDDTIPPEIEAQFPPKKNPKVHPPPLVHDTHHDHDQADADSPQDHRVDNSFDEGGLAIINEEDGGNPAAAISEARNQIE